MALIKVGGKIARSKRMKRLMEKLESGKQYDLQKSCEILVSLASAKFDETVELTLSLGVDPRKAEQNVRGSVSLPHGLGKVVRVAVFAKGDKANEALEAGADFVGAEDLAEKIKGGFMDFDNVVATPDLMVQVGKVGKLLGPRGLMPSPKVGTVTFDIGATVRSIKAGRAEYRVEKAGIVQAPIGKVSFGPQKIYENLSVMMQAIIKGKPATSKGIYLKAGFMSLTMSPGVELDLAPLRG